MGSGTLTTSEYTYAGSFQRGKFNGKGKIDYTSGNSYEGIFKNGMRHGRGTFKSSIGYVTRYTGDWAYDVRHGLGEIQYVTGDIFNGQFVNGQVRQPVLRFHSFSSQPEGSGKYVFQETGQIIEGKVKNGTFVGKVSVHNLSQVNLPNLSVSDDNNSSLHNILVQYAQPPTLPLFQFQ